MSKYYGIVGFATHVETSQSVWEEQIVEKPYYGDLIKINRQLMTNAVINDGVTVTNQISIIADAFANKNFLDIRYATVNGLKCVVTSVEVQRPRLILTLGGRYNA